MARKKKTDINLLRLKIDLEGFKLNVVSNNPDKTLFELNSLLKSKKELIDVMLSLQGEIDMYNYADENESGFEVIMRRFTKELISDKKSLDSIRGLFLKHKNFIYRKESLEAKQEIDLTNRRQSLVIEKKDISALIRKLLFDVNISRLKHVFVHILSDNFSKEHQGMFLDELRKKSGFAETTFISTPKKLNGVVVAETLFFGDFPQKEE